MHLLIFQQSSPQLQTQFSIVDHTMKGGAFKGFHRVWSAWDDEHDCCSGNRPNRCDSGELLRLPRHCALLVMGRTPSSANFSAGVLSRLKIHAGFSPSPPLFLSKRGLSSSRRFWVLAPPKALFLRRRPRAPQKLLASRDKDAAFWVRVQNDGLVPSLCTTSSWPASLL